MAKDIRVKALFVDVGGVLLSNGWDKQARELACEHFGLDKKSFESRHGLLVDLLERAKITLTEYLDKVIVGSLVDKEQFKAFMFSQSKPYSDMISLLTRIKHEFGLKVIALSNEGKELTKYRIATFSLMELFDFYIGSAFVALRKPDVRIYHLALDISQYRPSEVIYIDDRAFFAEVAQKEGIRSIAHENCVSTEDQLYNILKSSK